jgi:tripartite-type tricarboxylate transporter receptor subunit TctC
MRQLSRNLAALLWFVSVVSTAAEPYPSKPVTLVVPFGPGGNADLAARALAVVAEKYLGQPLVIINRAGAGGILGSQLVVNAPKDGYTLLLARVGSKAVAPVLDPATTYKWDSFTFLGMLELDPYVCVVKGTSPMRSVNDLTSAIKANPGKLSYASTGFADVTVVFPVKMLLNAGLGADAALKVPYKNGSDTVTSVISGQTDFVCNGFSLYVSALKSGALRGLVVSAHDRVPEAPDIPTAREVGMPDLERLTGWSALYGPPDLPKEVVDRWSNILGTVKSDPAWVEQVKRRLSIPSVMSPDETRTFAEDQVNTYKALAPQLSIK